MEIIKSDYIRDKLSYIESKVKSDTKQKLYDVNTTAEYIFMNVLNDVKGWQLVNANDIKPNFPAIDLIDIENEIVIQVTSSIDDIKVTSTIEKFSKFLDDEYKDGIYKPYAHYKLKIFYIKDKPKKFTKTTLTKIENQKMNLVDDFLGIEDINRKVSAEPKIATKVFETLCDIFHDNICNSNKLNPNLTTKSSTHDSSFLGREDEIKSIDEMLENSNSLLLINGIGGIGKSSLANHYLYTREKGVDYYGFIDGLDSFSSAFRVSLDLKAEKEEELYHEIISKLRDLKGDKLLVIDNVKDIESHKELMEMILSLEKYDYKILFISRRKIKQINSYYLSTLLPEDAQKLFLSYFLTDEIEKVDKIIDYLGLHTLFIKLVAEIVRNEGYTLDNIIEKFEDENGGLSKIEYIDEESGEELTFNQNLQELFSMQNLNDEYILLLKRLSVLPSIDIELSFLEEILGKERLKGRLNFLVSRGWLIENEESYKLHQIIKEFMLANYAPCFEEIEVILDYLLRLAIVNNEDVKIAVENKNNLVFFDTLGKSLDKIGKKNIKVGSFFANIGTIYYLLSIYEKVNFYYLKALDIYEEVLGVNHSETASLYNNLALFYRLMGRYEEAEPLLLKSLNICKKVFGENHPDTATSYNSLALLYRSIEKYDMAEKFYLETLKIREKILGEKHPDTISAYNNLAGLYASIGDYNRAEVLFIKSVKMSEDVLGECHPDTATSYDNLSLVYIRIGIYTKAEILSLKALKLRKALLGENHMSTITSYNNLALLYFYTEDFKKSYKYMKKVITIGEKILPKESPRLVSSKNQLIMIEKNYNKYMVD